MEYFGEVIVWLCWLGLKMKNKKWRSMRFF